MITRSAKVVLVWAVALYVTLVVFNNLTDYNSNFDFVSHVLAMDTTFPGNNGMWRAIDAPALHHAFYWLIIATEAVIAILCWLGGWRLLRSINDPIRFNGTKGVVVAGLTLGIVLWFTGFMTVGGEWFLMWQSSTWNGIAAASRLITILGITLLFVVLPDSETSA
ncbi:MAG: DUF2165 domain-containing protein [Caldilineales bacterium]